MDIATADPNQVLMYFEGFEDYAVSTDMVGVDGWERNTDEGIYTDAWTVVSDITDHTNKIFGGKQSVECRGAESNWLKRRLSTATDVVIRMGMWEEKSTAYGQIRLTYSDGDVIKNYIQFGPKTTGNDGFRVMSTNIGWCETASVNSSFKQYHEYIMRIHSTEGFSMYTQAGVMIFNNAGGTTASGNLDMYTVNGISFGGGNCFFDHIRYYKSFSTPDPFQVI